MLCMEGEMYYSKTKQYVMALDAGTTSNRAIIFDNESHIVSVKPKTNLPSISQAGC